VVTVPLKTVTIAHSILMECAVELIQNDKETGKEFVNKLAVGERQLASAIKMYFLELDPLAVHLVASAAHNVLADLMKDRGTNPAVHAWLYSLLRTAKELQTGEVTESDITIRTHKPA
jgi:hypothetical protein